MARRRFFVAMMAALLSSPGAGYGSAGNTFLSCRLERAYGTLPAFQEISTVITYQNGFFTGIRVDGYGEALTAAGHASLVELGVWAFFGVSGSERIKDEDGWVTGIPIGQFQYHVDLNKYSGSMTIRRTKLSDNEAWLEAQYRCHHRQALF